MRRSRRAIALGVAALTVFVVVGLIVNARPVTTLDATVQTWILGHQDPRAAHLSRWITILGGITAMRVVAVAAAARFLVRRAWVHAFGLVIVPLVTVPAFNLLKALYARPRPAGLGAGVDGDGAYPSGHAMTATAVCCTVAWTLWRAGVIRKGPAFAIAIAPPLLVGISRVYLNVHWATDVVGGWCTGVVIATLFVVMCERIRPGTSA